MPSATTMVSYVTDVASQSAPIVLKQTSVFVGGTTDPGSGITQAQADARYVRLPTGGNDNDVLTRVAGVGQWRPPVIFYDSTNW